MNRAFHRVATMCRVLDVSPSGYYAWRQRKPSARRQRDNALRRAIRAAHVASKRTYGRPRIHSDLADAGGRSTVHTLVQCPKPKHEPVH
jgi:putative transposase